MRGRLHRPLRGAPAALKRPAAGSDRGENEGRAGRGRAMTQKPRRTETTATDSPRIPFSRSDQPPRKPHPVGLTPPHCPHHRRAHTHGGDRPLLTLEFASQGSDFRSPLDVIVKQQLVGARPPPRRLNAEQKNARTDRIHGPVTRGCQLMNDDGPSWPACRAVSMTKPNRPTSYSSLGTKKRRSSAWTARTPPIVAITSVMPGW